MELDKADIRILVAVQENARIGLEALAETASLSVASVQRRLKQLRAKQIITREVAVLDPDKLGQPMSFIVMVEMERERPDQIDAFSRLVLADPQVQQCYYITGEADFCLICSAADMKGFEALTQRLFFNNNNVRCFKTSVVMGKKKVGLNVDVSGILT
ncbi:Lrp/AsnC family transcriptional regulator [Thalassomonas actiniarum]|uniref:Lrp/AsnC family transcriptional regulator n=1 Tax=Thalassomonas actiniarum TaxID=485447 RepID=A0AAE9YUD6_9GAMM|nr:Lrp/AsnC family transcriptional regulator [Thalassomonas actiniarum]WDE01281.1 Lrp/AsnC family transcriptional regulator [Thalassomonas actiniarum]